MTDTQAIRAGAGNSQACRHARFTFATDEWSDAQCTICKVKGSVRFVPNSDPARSSVERALLQSVEDLLAYAEDVLSNKEQLACFKPGVVQAHVKAARAAIEAATPCAVTGDAA